jgi:hypothetical protein
VPKLAIPWLSRTDWPLELCEHATRSTENLLNMLNCIDRLQGQNATTGTLTVISKTLRIPEFTTIQDALNMMQSEVKDIAEETVHITKTVKMEMRNTSVDIKRSIKIGEERKAATRESMGRSRTTVNIVKASKDKTPCGVVYPGESGWSAVAHSDRVRVGHDPRTCPFLT